MINRQPDIKNALSIIESAKREMEFTLTIKASSESASTIIRNIYESFRMLGDALLILKGIKSQDHIQPIKELIKLNLNTLRPINLVDSLRILRHNINYYGYRPNLDEVEDAISFSKDCFIPLFNEVMKKIKELENKKI